MNFPGSKSFFKKIFTLALSADMRFIEARLHLRWSMLNRKSQSRLQSLLPLPDFSRKIEGVSARRVMIHLPLLLLASYFSALPESWMSVIFLALS